MTPAAASGPPPRPLADLTTLRVGGPARRLVEVATEQELVELIAAADAAGEPALVLGAGSNVVIADDGFPGVVALVRTSGVRVESDDSCGGVFLRVAAGERWDDVAARAAAEDWAGVEALAGIPGLAGATPIQNVGAYGQEVAQTIASVRTYDRVEGRIRTYANADCEFAYRSSRFRGDARWVVLEVTFQLRRASLSGPLRYAELASALGVEPGERAPLRDVREAVLALRRGKGMVLDDGDHDTWSAGSFFTNPVVAAEAVPPGAPAWPQEGGVKVSAAWLIERAGYGRGHPGPGGRVGVSGKHALALTNRGTGSAQDLLGLAREIRDAVVSRFGIVLTPEPVLVGCELS